MKSLIAMALISFVVTSSANAAENVFCFKGLSPAEQAQNLRTCEAQRKSGQRCETNAWKHGGAVYDVCLQGSERTLQVVFCLRGLSPAEQNSNLKACRRQATADQVCETNLWIHRNAAYDVCIMQ